MPMCISVYLWSPAGNGLTSWLSFVVSYCEFLTFQLVTIRILSQVWYLIVSIPDLCTLTKRVWYRFLCCRHCWKLGVHTRVVPVSHRLFLLHGTRILSVFPSMNLLQDSSINMSINLPISSIFYCDFNDTPHRLCWNWLEGDLDLLTLQRLQLPAGWLKCKLTKGL